MQSCLPQQIFRSLITKSMGMAFWVLLFIFPAGVDSAAASDIGKDYFYLQEAAPDNLRNTCSSVFDAIAEGKEGDVGVIVRSLKTINVTYLLDDYDNSLGTDRRKKALKLEDLLAEVEKNKRAIYCKIELALYLEKQNYGHDPVYGDLLSDAFMALDEVYSAAQKSLAQENFARASYAFDLIAPYKDAYQLHLQSAESRKANSVVKSPAPPATNESGTAVDRLVTAAAAGPITLAVAAAQNRPITKVADPSGPIALAAKPGPITVAVNAMADSAQSPDSDHE